MVLKPTVAAPGQLVIRRGDEGKEMYFLVQGEVDVLGAEGHVIAQLGPGSFFGETSLLRCEPRNASIQARSYCELFVLEKADFNRVLRDHPQFARSILEACRRRYQVDVRPDQAFDREVNLLID